MPYPPTKKPRFSMGSVAFSMCVCAMCVIRTDRRRHPHRPTQTSASTDVDIRTDRCRRPHRPTRMAFLLLYMRSGTSMPSSAMPFFSVLPTF
ncbi:hypothetical protein [Leyella stercorea]|uniref:hypothetical protein n=1 Tax=Leyella stercorea TaxID=363265 RepID=UPI0024311B11|nr:hypothetical protein [Leyella stercorea]